MVSKAKLKFIKSLQIKKYRHAEQRFVVEGAKSVLELLNADFKVDFLLATPAFLSAYNPGSYQQQPEVIEVSEMDLIAAGSFESNKYVLAVAQMAPDVTLQVTSDEFALVLDDIRDPGNLGTIIRIADWYGITKIIASAETADFYNPKVIHASMGSFTRVKICYEVLTDYLGKNDKPVFGAFMEGESVHEIQFGKGGLIIIGNEAQGVKSELENFITRKITIPRFGKAESLNAAIATAVICDNLKRLSKGG